MAEFSKEGERIRMGPFHNRRSPMFQVASIIRIHKTLGGFVLGCCLAITFTGIQSASANSATLQWAGNSESDLMGYKIYQGTTPGSYGPSIDVGNNTIYTARNLQSGRKYFFAVTAYDNRGNESPPSVEVSLQTSVPLTDSLQPKLTSPALGSRLTGLNETFSWTGNGVNVTEWWLYIGTSRGERDIYDSGSIGMTSGLTVRDFATNGAKLYVRLWYKKADKWEYWDTSYVSS